MGVLRVVGDGDWVATGGWGLIFDVADEPHAEASASAASAREIQRDAMSLLVSAGLTASTRPGYARWDLTPRLAYGQTASRNRRTVVGIAVGRAPLNTIGMPGVCGVPRAGFEPATP